MHRLIYSLRNNLDGFGYVHPFHPQPGCRFVKWLLATGISVPTILISGWSSSHHPELVGCLNTSLCYVQYVEYFTDTVEWKTQFEHQTASKHLPCTVGQADRPTAAPQCGKALKGKWGWSFGNKRHFYKWDCDCKRYSNNCIVFNSMYVARRTSLCPESQGRGNHRTNPPTVEPLRACQRDHDLKVSSPKDPPQGLKGVCMILYVCCLKSNFTLRIERIREA